MNDYIWLIRLYIIYSAVGCTPKNITKDVQSWEQVANMDFLVSTGKMYSCDSACMPHAQGTERRGGADPRAFPEGSLRGIPQRKNLILNLNGAFWWLFHASPGTLITQNRRVQINDSIAKTLYKQGATIFHQWQFFFATQWLITSLFATSLSGWQMAWWQILTSWWHFFLPPRPHWPSLIIMMVLVWINKLFLRLLKLLLFFLCSIL